MNKNKYPKNYPTFHEVEAGKTYQWCGCGQTKTEPLCDRTDCTQVISYRAIVSETVLFCGCKQTQEPPFCDGTHSLVKSRYIGD